MGRSGGGRRWALAAPREAPQCAHRCAVRGARAVWVGAVGSRRRTNKGAELPRNAIVRPDVRGLKVASFGELLARAPTSRTRRCRRDQEPALHRDLEELGLRLRRGPRGDGLLGPIVGLHRLAHPRRSARRWRSSPCRAAPRRRSRPRTRPCINRAEAGPMARPKRCVIETCPSRAGYEKRSWRSPTFPPPARGWRRRSSQPLTRCRIGLRA